MEKPWPLLDFAADSCTVFSHAAWNKKPVETSSILLLTHYEFSFAQHAIQRRPLLALAKASSLALAIQLGNAEQKVNLCAAKASFASRCSIVHRSTK